MMMSARRARRIDRSDGRGGRGRRRRQIADRIHRILRFSIQGSKRTVLHRSGGGTIGATATGRVLVEQRHAREGLEALGALVLLDVAVRLHVSAQVGAVGKGARANLAPKRLLARVRAHVALEQPRSTEALAAYLALARQRVRANVHLERTERCVHLVAVLAREVLEHLGAAVELLVLGEAAECRVALAAAVALIAAAAVVVVVVVVVRVSHGRQSVLRLCGRDSGDGSFDKLIGLVLQW